eukprot:gene31986-38676_t
MEKKHTLLGYQGKSRVGGASSKANLKATGSTGPHARKAHPSPAHERLLDNNENWPNANRVVALPMDGSISEGLLPGDADAACRRLFPSTPQAPRSSHQAAATFISPALLSGEPDRRGRGGPAAASGLAASPTFPETPCKTPSRAQPSDSAIAKGDARNPDAPVAFAEEEMAQKSASAGAEEWGRGTDDSLLVLASPKPTPTPQRECATSRTSLRGVLLSTRKIRMTAVADKGASETADEAAARFHDDLQVLSLCKAGAREVLPSAKKSACEGTEATPATAAQSLAWRNAGLSSPTEVVAAAHDPSPDTMKSQWRFLFDTHVHGNREELRWQMMAKVDGAYHFALSQYEVAEDLCMRAVGQGALDESGVHAEAMEKWMSRMRSTPEFSVVKEQKEDALLSAEEEKMQCALTTMRSFIPVGIQDMSQQDLMQRAQALGGLLPFDLAAEIKHNRLLHWIVSHPEDIESANFLTGESKKYFENVHSHDITEIRALVAVLPKKFKSDNDGQKAAWRSNVISLFEKLVLQENQAQVKGAYDPKTCSRPMVACPPLLPHKVRRPLYFYMTKEECSKRTQQLRDKARKHLKERVERIRDSIEKAPVSLEQHLEMTEALVPLLASKASFDWMREGQAPHPVIGSFPTSIILERRGQPAAKFISSEEAAALRKDELCMLSNKTTNTGVAESSGTDASEAVVKDRRCAPAILRGDDSTESSLTRLPATLIIDCPAPSRAGGRVQAPGGAGVETCAQTLTSAESSCTTPRKLVPDPTVRSCLATIFSKHLATPQSLCMSRTPSRSSRVADADMGSQKSELKGGFLAHTPVAPFTPAAPAAPAAPAPVSKCSLFNACVLKSSSNVRSPIHDDQDFMGLTVVTDSGSVAKKPVATPLGFLDAIKRKALQRQGAAKEEEKEEGAVAAHEELAMAKQVIVAAAPAVPVLAPPVAHAGIRGMGATGGVGMPALSFLAQIKARRQEE